MERPLLIGTRGSPLALAQARIVQSQLATQCPNRPLELRIVAARADEEPERPLQAMGGEGVFVKELEAALLDGRIALAVHSMKDVPLAPTPGLCLAAILAREDARDALVSRSGVGVERLPHGSRVGTSSLRRRSQLLHHRGDLQVSDIRGNVDTRLRKLEEGRYDAIVVAGCGLTRLALAHRITEWLEPSLMLPEPGQGALALQARADDAELLTLLRGLEDAGSRACVEAERAFLQALGGGCRVPIAAYASRQGDALTLEGGVFAPDGSRALRGRLSGPAADPITLGQRLANQLAHQGAQSLLCSSDS